MMRWLLWTLVGLLLGVGVHLVTIIALPRLTAQSGFQRAAEIAPIGRFVVLTAERTPLPLPDPSVVTALCRYDLAAGPVGVHVPTGTGFVSASFYTPAGLNFYALTDRASTGEAIDLTLFTAAQLADIRAHQGPDTPDDLRVQAPESQGMIVARAVISEPGALAEVTSRSVGPVEGGIQPRHLLQPRLSARQSAIEVSSVHTPGGRPKGPPPTRSVTGGRL
jgi:uncharacterized membrane protein